MNKVRLNAVKHGFIADLKPKYIMPYLVNYKVVTEEESEDILQLASSQQQVEILFDILACKGNTEMERFIKVLDMKDECGENYPWLAELLKETNFSREIEHRRDLKENVYKLLIDGGVPFQTNCLLNRENKLIEIRKELIEAANRRYWVVLHGMTGTGKSVLAAEAIRNNELIDRYFYEGVFWTSLGNLTDSNSIELKMKKLYQKILETKKVIDLETNFIPAIESLEDLNHKLKKIVTGKMLVVLDDLWEKQINELDVVHLFDIGCPILITTKFPGAFEKYSHYCSLIPCKNDLQLDESKELLSLYVNCEKENLPPSVDFICKKCKGSPFSLSHIGRYMSRFGNDINRWNHLEELFQKGLRQRHSSENELNNIKEIIHLTLQPIEDYKTFFFDFVIFPDDDWVPSQVFSVLWDKHVFDVEDTMYQLTRNSLVQYEKDPIYGYCYGIHDLYLEVLKGKCDDVTERHLRLVNNYLKLCKKKDGNYDFSLLPNDDYIHYYIAHHMSFVDEKDIVDGITLDDIYFDLHFVKKKLQKNSRDLIWDYHNYEFKNQEALEVFKSFAEKNAHNIFINQDCDIVQLGLFEPPNSIIYQKAFKIASKAKDKAYFIWRNQSENQCHMQNLNLKRNLLKNIKHATISSDGMLVACADSENKAVIFASSTGEELLTLSGHTCTINYCMFNNCRDKLVTASDDKTVKIFELPLEFTQDMRRTKKRSSFPIINTEVAKTPDISSVTFPQHHAAVLCCCYSHDEELIVSSDNNGYVHVWQSYTAYLKWSVHHASKNSELQPAHVCSFSPDSTIFGTAANDSVKLWMTSDGKPYKEFFHDEMLVKGFCFKKDDLVISVADNEIYKHDIKSGKLEKFKCSRNLVITCCCLSPDGNFLACGTSENSVIVFNINTHKLINNLKGHKSDILSVMYTADAKKLLAVSEDGYILYDMIYVKDTSLHSFEGNLSVKKFSDDLMIASSNYFECIEVRKGITAELFCKTDPDCNEITACSLSPDCSEVVYGTKIGSVKVFNIQNNLVDDLPKHFGQINYITHFENNIFFTCSEDKTIKVWDNKRSPKVLRGHYDAVLMCVPFKKSYKLLSCSRDGTLRVWDIKDKKCILSTDGHGNQDVRCCDISFDETLLASASADRTVKLWNADNGVLFRTLECEKEVRCCRFSPLYHILVAGCDSGEVKHWTLGKKPVSKTLYHHSSCVYNIYFDKSGSQFLSIADDIKILNTKKLEPQTLLLPSSSIGVARPSIWASDNFDTFVVIVNSVLYVLTKVANTTKTQEETHIIAHLKKEGFNQKSF